MKTAGSRQNAGGGSPAVMRLPVQAGLVPLAAIMFALAHPNPLAANGLPVLAWLMYLPALLVLNRSALPGAAFWGAVYGFTAFALFNYWLSSYHLFAGIFLSLLYLVYFAVLFLALRLAARLCPRVGFILQWLVFVAFEYLRTLGFLGYPYGITGYTQWQTLPLIQTASVAGVWGVSALVLFPQTLAAWQLARLRPGTPLSPAVLRSALGGKLFPLRPSPASVSLGVYLLILAASLVYGFTARSDFSGLPSVDIALIQHNTDPWKDGLSDYENNFRVLKRLSEEALERTPKPGLVVWSETAFVPMIYWHSRYRTDSAYRAQVRALLDFLSRQSVPFVIGNDDGRREMTEDGVIGRVDYNAALLFERGEMTGVYRKMRLVPFTEHFPYKKRLPFIYKLLEDMDTHFWKAGTEATVFSADGLRFSTPICFEDTFGYLSREFVRNGAEVIVNLSNDAWSHSRSAQMQHLSMAVFRSVENRRAMARATASGQTCAIAPDGRITAMAPSFTEAALSVSVPVLTEQTFYTRHGDYLPLAFIAAALLMAAAGLYRALFH